MILIFLLLFLFGCNSLSSSKREDTFYSTFGGMGHWIRLPFIKPYEAKIVNPDMEESSWSIYPTKSLFIIGNIEYIDVQDSVIYILAGQVGRNKDSTAIGTRNVPTAWFAIDVRSGVEKGFESDVEFYQYLSTKQYKRPHWLQIDSLVNEIGKGKPLPWLPLN